MLLSMAPALWMSYSSGGCCPHLVGVFSSGFCGFYAVSFFTRTMQKVTESVD